MTVRKKPGAIPPGQSQEDARLATILKMFAEGKLNGVLAEAGQEPASRAPSPATKPASAQPARASAPKAVSSSDIPEGWVEIVRKPPAAKKKAEEIARKPLLLAQTGWSHQVVESGKLHASSSGVALAASKKEAEDLVDQLAHVTAPLAVLSPERVKGMDEAVKPIWVQTRTEEGRTVARKVFLCHLGTSATKVVYKPAAVQVRINADTVVINVSCTRDFATKETWSDMTSKPLDTVRKWLESQSITPVDVFHPGIHSLHLGTVQAKARIPATNLQNAMVCSGPDGMSTWEVPQVGKERLTRIIWLDKPCALQGGFVQARSLEQQNGGVVSRPGQVGVRVDSQVFGPAMQKILGPDAA